MFVGLQVVVQVYWYVGGVMQCGWVEEWQYYVWVGVDVLFVQGLVEIGFFVWQVGFGCYVQYVIQIEGGVDGYVYEG